MPSPKRKKKPSPKRPRRKVYGHQHIVALLCASATLAALTIAGLLLLRNSLQLPTITSVAHYQPKQASRIYDQHNRLIAIRGEENRRVVAIQNLPRYLPQAFVAAEDGRFFQHPGVDLFSVIRAAISNIHRGKRGHGGSTITQQVAKSLLLTPEKSYRRKIREAILAWQIDQRLSKNDILHIYLNQIYLGEGSYGVDAAALSYFGKSAKNLNLAEAALLAGLPQAPSRYSPLRNLSAARARQKYVLNRMAADGYISQELAQQAWHSKIKLQSGRLLSSPDFGYYLDYASAEAENILQHPLKQTWADIYTFLDPQKQSRAASTLRRTGKKFAHKNLQGALVAINNRNGAIVAMSGGKSYSKSQFNRASQAKRTVGSTFKPIIYAAALKTGMHPDSVISDAQLQLRDSSGKVWSPQNYSHHYHGDVSLQKALSHSYNMASIRLLQKIGFAPVMQMALAMGIKQELQHDLSLALGATEIPLLTMTAAYSTFARNGSYIEPRTIRTIITNTKQQYRNLPITHKVLSPQVAHEMQQMLAGVVSVGSGRKAAGNSGIRGGKTGTSNDNRDLWFIGYNKKYTTGLWFGNDNNLPLGSQNSGGSVAAPAWKYFMQK